MIIWIASYPKSGNTWLRALISSYFYSKDGIYDESLLKKIDQFPVRKYFKKFNYDKKKLVTLQNFGLAPKKILIMIKN